MTWNFFTMLLRLCGFLDTTCTKTRGGEDHPPLRMGIRPTFAGPAYGGVCLHLRVFLLHRCRRLRLLLRSSIDRVRISARGREFARPAFEVATGSAGDARGCGGGVVRKLARFAPCAHTTGGEIAAHLRRLWLLLCGLRL
jgi:hypothetical protein